MLDGEGLLSETRYQDSTALSEPKHIDLSNHMSICYSTAVSDSLDDLLFLFHSYFLSSLHHLTSQIQPHTHSSQPCSSNSIPKSSRQPILPRDRFADQRRRLWTKEHNLDRRVVALIPTDRGLIGSKAVKSQCLCIGRSQRKKKTGKDEVTGKDARESWLSGKAEWVNSLRQKATCAWWIRLHLLTSFG